MKSIGKLQLKVEKYESKEDRIMLPGQERKEARNGRVQKMQGAACSGLITRDKYALRGSVEICNAYLEHFRRLWKSQETNFAMHEDKIMPKLEGSRRVESKYK